MMMTTRKKGFLNRFFFFGGILLCSLFLGASASWAIVVTNAADDGPGSLRRAILDARDGLPTPITFDPAVFPATIAVGSITGSPLPALIDSGDTIDGSGTGVILDGSALTDTETYAEVGLRVRASDITVRGLTIQNFPEDGIRVEPPPPPAPQGVTVSGVVISENIIRGNLDGLRVSGQLGPENFVGATIVNNEFSRNRDDGIFVRGSQGNGGGNTVRVQIDSNLLRGSQGVVTGGTTSGDGIRVLGGSGYGSNNTVVAVIVNNDIRNNVDDGIVVAGAGGDGQASNNTVSAQIVGNKLRNNGAPSSSKGVGIAVRGGNYGLADIKGWKNLVTFLVANNKIKDSKDNGIAVGGGLGDSHTVRGSVSGNDVAKSGTDGIAVGGGGGTNNALAGIRLVENKVTTSARQGIRVTGGSGQYAELSGILIAGNKSDKNDADGIAVFPGNGTGNAVSLAGITDNKTDHNGRNGILVFTDVPGSGATPVSSNQANRNEAAGIDLQETGYVVLSNTANKNLIGISATGNIDGGGNKAKGNTDCNTPGCF